MQDTGIFFLVFLRDPVDKQNFFGGDEMSHYTRVSIEFRDKEALLQAIRDLGYSPVVYSEPQHLWGYEGALRPETAEIVIPRQQIHRLSNDVGFAKRGEVYELIVSEWDAATVFNAEKINRLKQRYAYHAARAFLERAGYTFTETTDPVSGAIHLVFAG